MLHSFLQHSVLYILHFCYKGYLQNFPGLTARALRKHPPHSFAMVKGHLDQVRQNVKSTKSTKAAPNDTSDDHLCPIQDDSPERTHCCYLAVMEPTGQIYTDQTKKSVASSSNGNNYHLICYSYDSNAILAVAFKNRTAACIKTAFESVHRRLCKAGLRPAFHRLDNECSDILKPFFGTRED
jgi:hypothetical protein